MLIYIPKYEYTPKSESELHDLIDIISFYLQSNFNNRCFLSKFTSMAVPGISINDYLKRYTNYLGLDEAHLLAALVYLSRYLRNTKDLLTNLNIHRLLASIMCITHKYLEDEFFHMQWYAQLAGLKTWEMRALETEMLGALKFEMLINPRVLVEFKEFFCSLAREQEKIHPRKYLLSLTLQEELYLHPEKLKVALKPTAQESPTSERKNHNTLTPHSIRLHKCLPKNHLFHYDPSAQTERKQPEQNQSPSPINR